MANGKKEKLARARVSSYNKLKFLLPLKDWPSGLKHLQAQPHFEVGPGNLGSVGYWLWMIIKAIKVRQYYEDASEACMWLLLFEIKGIL